MKQEVITEFSTNEIREKLLEEKNRYVKLKLNHSVSSIENPMKIKSSRKFIARLATELRKRLNQA